MKSATVLIYGERFFLYNCFHLLFMGFVITGSFRVSLFIDSGCPWNLRTESWHFYNKYTFFFLKFLEGISGATDTRVLGFWWRLLWVLQSQNGQPYSHLAEAYMLQVDLFNKAVIGGNLAFGIHNVKMTSHSNVSCKPAVYIDVDSRHNFCIFHGEF